MDRLDQMRLFVRVVDTTSFSKPAREKSIAQSTVSRQVAALESHLGAQLLRRTARGFSVTDAGRAYYDVVVRVLEELDATESQLSPERSSASSGQIRVSLPAAFGRMIVVPRLGEFFRRHPRMQLDLDSGDHFANLVEQGIDVAIRIGHLASSNLLARRIGSIEAATVATPLYLSQRGEPATPHELEKHACVVFKFDGSPRKWELKNAPPFIPAGPLQTNDAEHVRAGVLAGLGIAHAPTWLFAPEIASGAVLRILKSHNPKPYPIHAVWSGGRHTTARCKPLVDFLAQVLADNPETRIR